MHKKKCKTSAKKDKELNLRMQKKKKKKKKAQKRNIKSKKKHIKFFFFKIETKQKGPFNPRTQKKDSNPKNIMNILHHEFCLCYFRSTTILLFTILFSIKARYLSVFSATQTTQPDSMHTTIPSSQEYPLLTQRVCMDYGWMSLVSTTRFHFPYIDGLQAKVLIAFDQS
jgi:hypothetical protein